MRLTNLLGLCALGAIGCQGPPATTASPAPGEQQASTATEAASPASVRTFHQQMPIGLLGHPVGTVVRVTGVCVDGEMTRLKQYDGKILLRVQAVNGRELPEPVDFVYDRAADGVSKPKPGERFDYTVHEFGSFDGYVKLPLESYGPDTFSGNVIGLPIPRFGYRGEGTVHRAHSVK